MSLHLPVAEAFRRHGMTALFGADDEDPAVEGGCPNCGARLEVRDVSVPAKVRGVRGKVFTIEQRPYCANCERDVSPADAREAAVQWDDRYWRPR
jgi:hypothetical protein